MRVTYRQLRKLIRETMIQRQSGLSDILSQMQGHNIGDDAIYAQGYQDGSIRAPFPQDASDDYAAGYEDGLADSGHTHPLREELASSRRSDLSPHRHRYDVRGEPISSLDPEAYKSIQRTIIKPGLDPEEQEEYDEVEYDRGYQDGLEDLPREDNAGPDYSAGYDTGQLEADLPETDWRESRSEDW